MHLAHSLCTCSVSARFLLALISRNPFGGRHCGSLAADVIYSMKVWIYFFFFPRMPYKRLIVLTVSRHWVTVLTTALTDTVTEHLHGNYSVCTGGVFKIMLTLTFSFTLKIRPERYSSKEQDEIKSHRLLFWQRKKTADNLVRYVLWWKYSCWRGKTSYGAFIFVVTQYSVQYFSWCATNLLYCSKSEIFPRPEVMPLNSMS